MQKTAIAEAIEYAEKELYAETMDGYHEGYNKAMNDMILFLWDKLQKERADIENAYASGRVDQAMRMHSMAFDYFTKNFTQ